MDAELEVNRENHGETVLENSTDKFPNETVTVEEVTEATAETKLENLEELLEDLQSIEEITPATSPIASLVSAEEETKEKADGSTLGESKVALPCSEESGEGLGDENDAEINGMEIYEGSSAVEVAVKPEFVAGCTESEILEICGPVDIPGSLMPEVMVERLVGNAEDHPGVIEVMEKVKVYGGNHEKEEIKEAVTKSLDEQSLEAEPVGKSEREQTEEPDEEKQVEEVDGGPERVEPEGRTRGNKKARPGKEQPQVSDDEKDDVRLNGPESEGQTTAGRMAEPGQDQPQEAEDEITEKKCDEGSSKLLRDRETLERQIRGCIPRVKMKPYCCL